LWPCDTLRVGGGWALSPFLPSAAVSPHEAHAHPAYKRIVGASIFAPEPASKNLSARYSAAGWSSLDRRPGARLVSVTAASNRALSAANAGVGPFHRS
jgi:hypothetical protein